MDIIVENEKDVVIANSKEVCKALFSFCQTDHERRSLFFDLVRSTDIPRVAIVLAMKELGIQDDMSLKTADKT